MLNFLADGNWLTPQVDFLVFLQNIRLAHSEIFNKFFLSITVFGEIWLPTLICAIVYWCINTKNGLYLFSVFGFNAVITHFIKLTAGIYRPWILSDKVKPIESALNYAKSYSFPSGHTATATSVLGGIAFVCRKYKFVPILMILLILMIGFSRLWLGVHTPQDVVVGLIIGITLIIVVNAIINWAEQDRNRYLYLIGIVNIIGILALIYIRYIHNYPIDYVDGKILVNPMHAIHDSSIFYGYALGLINGAMICRRFFPFEADKGSLLTRIFRGIIGSALLLLLLRGVLETILSNNYNTVYSILGAFSFGILITAIYPLIFTTVEKKLFDK